MEFRIADSFTDSLARLQGQDQKAVKTTAFDLQLDPARPGLNLHKLAHTKDPAFWSVRVSRDIRLIVHKSERSLLLCFVDHHDKAYAWAERRRIERHPRTGAAQLVEIRERVEQIPVDAEAVAAKPALFAHQPDDALLSYGVPEDWLEAVRRVDEDGLFALAEHLPQEAAEALLDLAVGATPKVAEERPDEDPFAHPDAQRRFRVMTNLDELRQALEYPFERWAVFLHPAQRALVERRFAGPARVVGSAGTGKTVVALHRAAHLAKRGPEHRVLVTTSPAIPSKESVTTQPNGNGEMRGKLRWRAGALVLAVMGLGGGPGGAHLSRSGPGSTRCAGQRAGTALLGKEHWRRGPRRRPMPCSPWGGWAGERAGAALMGRSEQAGTALWEREHAGSAVF